jgi:prepilin-type N-terminal cleavage/methylation domain-containing protein/prepilin-type processing-associated H-X9-DG protein
MNLHNKRGFTLIELLVVIAIIAILASLIVPSAGSALDRAKTTACASNLKQISAAILSYAADNNSQLPQFNRDVTKQGDNASWVGALVLGGYIDAPVSESRSKIPSNSVFRCPAGLTDAPSNVSIPSDPWTPDPDVHRPWASAQDMDSTTKFFHTWYGLNAWTENPQFPFARWNKTAPINTFTTQLTQMDKTVMVYDGCWTHNSTPLRVYARHGNPRSITNMAFFDGRVESNKTRIFDVNGTASDVYPRFRK